MDNYLEVSSVHKTYKKLALSGASFSVGPGDILALIGEANSGITLLMKLLLNLARPDRGEITYFGIKDFADERAIKQQLGVLMAECYFPENLTVANVDSFLGSVYESHSSPQFMEYSNRFKLDPKKRMKELTLPQKLRVNLAAAMTHSAKLLVLDGATRGLDVHERDFVNSMLAEYMAADSSRAIVIAARMMSEVPEGTNLVSFFRRGVPLFSGERSNPSDLYGVIHMGKKEYDAFDTDLAIGVRETDSGFDVLVSLEEVSALGLPVAPARVEDIISLVRKGVS